MAATPKPRKRPKTMICKMLPSANAFMGFAGIIPITVSQNESPAVVACSVEACAIIEAMPSALKPAPGLKMRPAVMAITIETTVVSKM